LDIIPISERAGRIVRVHLSAIIEAKATRGWCEVPTNNREAELKKQNELLRKLSRPQQQAQGEQPIQGNKEDVPSEETFELVC
jgi:hypothetical protein